MAISQGQETRIIPWKPDSSKNTRQVTLTQKTPLEVPYWYFLRCLVHRDAKKYQYATSEWLYKAYAIQTALWVAVQYASTTGRIQGILKG